MDHNVCRLLRSGRPRPARRALDGLQAGQQRPEVLLRLSLDLSHQRLLRCAGVRGAKDAVATQLLCALCRTLYGGRLDSSAVATSLTSSAALRPNVDMARDCCAHSRPAKASDTQHQADPTPCAQCHRCDMCVWRGQAHSALARRRAQAHSASGEGDANARFATFVCVLCGLHCTATAASPPLADPHRSLAGLVSRTEWPVGRESHSAERARTVLASPSHHLHPSTPLSIPPGLRRRHPAAAAGPPRPAPSRTPPAGRRPGAPPAGPGRAPR